MHTEGTVDSSEFRSDRLIAAVVVVAAILRFTGLAGFPEIQADEGLWTNSSKNFVAFGDWFMDGRTHLFLSPLFHGVSVLMFKALGPSIWAARLISAVAGTASVAILYAVVVRATRDRELGLLTAVVFGWGQSAVLLSRYALIEPLELSLGLAAAAMALRTELWAAAAAGALFGLALLAKTNLAFLIGAFIVYALIRPVQGEGASRRHRVMYVCVLASVAILVAGAVYAWLYFMYPARFIHAFRFELDGKHFERFSHPLIRVGRFGIDPVQSGRTVIALVRDAPFLMVLGSLGFVTWCVRRPRGSSLFAIWLGLGVPFFLIQMFQPLRYFFLVAPALAFFAALAIMEFTGGGGVPTRTSSRLRAAVLMLYVGFNLSYLGMSAVANRGRMLQPVVRWAASNVPRSDNVMAAGYLCTDLPNRAYAYYLLAATPEQLLQSIRQYNIRYVIVDNREWPAQLREVVQSSFPVVQSWDFGAAYQVTAAALDRTGGTSAP